MFKGFNMITISVDANDLVSETEANGYFILKNVIDLKEVVAVRNELLPLFDDDIECRNHNNIRLEDWDNDEYQTSLTDKMHTILFPSCRSSMLAHLINELISNPTIQLFLERVIGKHYRLRVDLVRLSSGVNDRVDDFELPHAWHRDSPYSSEQPENHDPSTLEQRLQLRKRKLNLYQLAHWEKLWAVKRTLANAKKMGTFY